MIDRQLGAIFINNDISSLTGILSLMIMEGILSQVIFPRVIRSYQRFQVFFARVDLQIVRTGI